MSQNGHDIHIGTRNGATIVRAFKDNILLELVPRDVFRGKFGSDLPLTLIDECFHWLNLATGVVEIRKKHRVWFKSLTNWSLNLTTRIAERNKGSKLVDPRSDIATRVAKIFDGFEDSGHITVYYPPNGPFYVDLRRLELVFRVGTNNLLESPQLRSEIDPDQNAGCLHGLKSSLVIREKANLFNRAILVPKLPLSETSSTVGTSWGRNSYPSVRIEPSGFYLLYQIDTTLGRLTGAMEPQILYQLALMHALTSSIVPDELTGLTGSEQALKILRSAHCQPHIPLPPNTRTALGAIAQLSPSREFYPPDLQSMQKVTFKPGLTLAIQRDEFRILVNSLYQVSDSLVVFHTTTAQQVGRSFLRCSIASQRCCSA